MVPLKKSARQLIFENLFDYRYSVEYFDKTASGRRIRDGSAGRFNASFARRVRRHSDLECVSFDLAPLRHHRLQVDAERTIARGSAPRALRDGH